MPFPFVAVTLPDETPPPYVAGLLSACTQAYHEGTCGIAGGRPPPAQLETEGTSAPEPRLAEATPSNGAAVASESRILADVRWEDTTTATLQLGLPHWRNHRWLTRTITFKEHDQLVERYRAIGFTIGSLSITVAEVARLEQEAREGESEPEPTAPTTATPSSEPPSPAAPPAPASSQPFTRVEPAAHATPSNWFVSGYVAGELGEGFDAIRRGGTLGVGIYGQYWGGHVSGYYTDASGNGLTAAFSGVELKLDVRLTAKVFETRVSVGAGYGHLDAKVTKEATHDFATGVVSVNIRPSQWAVAPFLGVGARVFRGFTTDVPALDDLGPVAPYVQLGVTFNAPHDSP